MSIRKIGAIVLVVIVLVMGSLFLYLRKPSVAPGEEAPKISRAEIENILLLSKATFGYPKMLTDEVRADDARITDKDEFEVLVTLVKMESSNPHLDDEIEKAKARLPAEACDIRQVRFLLYKGITVLLTFRAKDQADLFQYVITPKMCGE